MKKVHVFCSLLLFFLVITSCNSNTSHSETDYFSSSVVFLDTPAAPNTNSAHTHEFFAMDTYMTVTAYGRRAGRAISEIERDILMLEAEISVTLPGSFIHMVNSGGEAESLMEDTPLLAGILRAAQSAREATDGAFNPMLYPVMNAWGFYSGEYRVPPDSELNALLALTHGALDYPIDLVAGAGIDLGGIAKGYVTDHAADTLKSYGVESAIINFGGNVYALGSRRDGNPWRVAVQDPHDADAFVGILHIENLSAVTSGGYVRYFEFGGVRYHHILDPATGRPANSGLASVTVVGENSAWCDALSTALFVVGLDRSLELWRGAEGELSFEAVFVADDGEVLVTEGLLGDIGFFASGDRAFTAIGR